MWGAYTGWGNGGGRWEDVVDEGIYGTGREGCDDRWGLGGGDGGWMGGCGEGCGVVWAWGHIGRWGCVCGGMGVGEYMGRVRVVRYMSSPISPHPPFTSLPPPMLAYMMM